MQKALVSNPRIAKRLLLLCSLYARTDARSLMRMRSIVDKLAWASQISPLSAPALFVSTGVSVHNTLHGMRCGSCGSCFYCVQVSDAS
jgi:hypothetical protein